MQPMEPPVYKRKMGYPTPRKSQQSLPGRPTIVPFLHRKRNHRYSYLLDGDEDEDTGKEPVGFFSNNRSRFNRHRDDLSIIPSQKSFHAADDDTVATSGSSSPEKVSWSTRDLGLLLKRLNASQPNIDGTYRSKSGRGDTPATLSCPKDDNISKKLEKADNDYAATEIESSEDDSSVESRTQTSVLSKPRLVRFADEMGLPLMKTTVFEDDDLERTKRLIILLLSPIHRKFEFVHASYRILERMTLSDITEQLPDLATNEILAQQRYTSLCRVRFGYQELINTVAVQNCGLGQDEVLIAIVEGYKGKDLVEIALPIFSNQHIVRAVKLAKRSGRAVKDLQSRASMDQRLATEDSDNRVTTEAKKLEEKHPGHVKMPLDSEDEAPTEVPASTLLDQRKPMEIEARVDDGEEEPDDADRLVFSIPNHAELPDFDATPSPLPPPARFLNTGVALTLAYFILSAGR